MRKVSNLKPISLFLLLSLYSLHPWLPPLPPWLQSLSSSSLCPSSSKPTSLSPPSTTSTTSSLRTASRRASSPPPSSSIPYQSPANSTSTCTTPVTFSSTGLSSTTRRLGAVSNMGPSPMSPGFKPRSSSFGSLSPESIPH